MISCEGYKMFKGIMRIVPKDPKFPCKEIDTVWLYKPEHDCWYGAGSSYPTEICEIIDDRTD